MIHPEKYRGSLPVIYRSGLELTFSRFCDTNPTVISWGSETVVIPYIRPSDNRMHRYFVDYNVSFRDRTGNIKKYLVEVKPSSQLNPPKYSPNKKQQTFLKEQYNFAMNTAKFEAAKAWCAKNNYEFIIITEKHLKNVS